jgi:L-rhamnose isomerase
MEAAIEKALALARERYAELGVDVDEALERLARVPISLQCWQGDDVRGFERPDAALSGGGIQVTGNHPGAARNPGELRGDLEKVYSLLPGRHRLNLHAMYGEFGPGRVDRDEVAPAHFHGWVSWARGLGIGLDFNATLFSHPRADDGFTLSSRDPGTRSFWIRHVRQCRAVAASMGEALASPCIHNLWIPDGCKDACTDRAERRKRLRESLDEIYSTAHPPTHLKDAVESKLFGIGSESFVVGSHEFYLAYALGKGLMVCLDLGHFHPTESVADKISSILAFQDELLLHLSRGVRWDSDHVVLFDDPVREVMLEVVRADALDRVHLALDFFDASLNRVGAWVTGARAVLKAVLYALLEPRERLRGLEEGGDNFGRLALLEECRSLPLGAVWDAACQESGVPPDGAWQDEVRVYEREVLSRRGGSKGDER